MGSARHPVIGNVIEINDLSCFYHLSITGTSITGGFNGKGRKGKTHSELMCYKEKFLGLSVDTSNLEGEYLSPREIVDLYNAICNPPIPE